MMARLVAAVLAAMVAGCAPLAVDDNVAAVQRYAREELGAPVVALDDDRARAEARQEVERLLASPLAMEDAVRIALAYSPSFQAALAGNAARSAAVTRSARLPNPVFAFERLVRKDHGASETEITRSLAFSVIDLVFLPSRLQAAGDRQEELRLKSAGDVLQLVTEVRQAWVRAVAAQQAVGYHVQVQESAEASAELARRMRSVGNWSRLAGARQQAFYADATAQLARARHNALAAREALVRLLGLDEALAARLELPQRLPELPAAVRDEKDVARFALDKRLDVRMARAELDATARELGLTRVASVVNGLELKGIRERESGAAPRRGFEVEFPLPVFDFGDARRAEARALYAAAFNRASHAALHAASQVRETYGAYRTAYDLARHYRDEVVPLRRLIADEMLLRYNGMLANVFELLADAREQAQAVMLAIDAQRDFWLADAALQAALLGRPGSAPSMDPLPAGGPAVSPGH